MKSRTREENKRCYEIMLNYNCDARCKFCSQGSFDKSLNADFRDICRRILSGYHAGYGRLGFTGGEPLIYRDVIRVVSFARAAGFGFIRIQTNGIRLADAGFARRLAGAGLTYCKFSIHSHRPRIHDYLVGVRGAWKRAVAGISNTRKLNIRVGMNILVNKMNYKDLGKMLKYFLELGVGDFVIIYPTYEGAMKTNAKTLGISLPVLQPELVKAVDIVAGAGVDFLFLNVPPCFAKGHEERVIMGDFNTIVTYPTGQSQDLDENRGKEKLLGKPCLECTLKNLCMGADRNYISIWGWKGFNPVKNHFPRTSDGAAPQVAADKKYFTDNERCMIKILAEKDNISTQKLLETAKDIPLCQDCTDGNAVITAGEKLIRSKIVTREERNGIYFWRLIKDNIGI